MYPGAANMSLRIYAWKLIFIVILFNGLTHAVYADRPPANVPPTWEIEVLDPNADPLSRPAVELTRGENGMTVDIPPVVLVHRYYFTGERSFQAQLLPGGPTIVVANHPRTGERTYIDVQMPPGTPRVTYTDHAIEYDFGRTSVSVCFGLVGNPSVKYRSGPSVADRVSKILHVDMLKENAQTTQQRLKQSAARSRTMAYGAASTVGEADGRVLDPAKGMLESLPFGKIVFDPTRGDKLVQKADEHKREKAIKRNEKQQRYDEMTRKTIR
jgi:hypothetical protein